MFLKVSFTSCFFQLCKTDSMSCFLRRVKNAICELFYSGLYKTVTCDLRLVAGGGRTIYISDFYSYVSFFLRQCKRLTSIFLHFAMVETISPAYVAWRAGIYDNHIPTRFLAPIDCSKIPALLPLSCMPAVM